MPEYHVFGEYWADLDNKEIYSEFIEAENEDEARTKAQADILERNCGLSRGEIEVYAD
jgi:hypothetical protein